jgi:5-methylcytosine-specific restriction endonuclease McrA
LRKTTAADSFESASDFVERLRLLRQARRERKIKRQDRVSRGRLSRSERDGVLAKTGGRCHFCGDFIKDDKWQVDHLSVHSLGGPHSIDNYLPAHPSCNRYRFGYGPEEFLGVLKLGVWLRTLIIRKTPLGKIAAKAFSKHDCVRESRSKKQGASPKAIPTDAR